MNGWLVIDKPLGVSSTYVGQKLKRILKIKKIGHVGTLDPLASGVLIFVLGEATKLIPYLKKNQKTYECEITFGESRTTDDAEGDPVETSSHRPSKQDIETILPHFIGKIQQKPPAFSAIHINGKRAYQLAREGNLVDLPLRNVRIDHIELLEHTQSSVKLRVVCGSGVYIRSLGRDLAKKLGTFGYISLLKRTQDDCFSIKDAFLLEKVAEMMDKLKVRGVIHSMETVLDDIPVVSVTQEMEKLLRLGQSISNDSCNADLVWVHCNHIPVCLAKQYESCLIPKRVFN